MMADYPNANARLAAVARSWADGEVSHEAWRKVRNGIIRDITRNKRDCEGGDAPVAPAVAAYPSGKHDVVPPAALATSPGMPAVRLDEPVKPAEAVHEEVLLLTFLLALVLVAAIVWFYLF